MLKSDLRGKTALIAGGGKNLGGLLARNLARKGVSRLAIHYNSESSRPEAEATLADVKAAGAEGFLFQGDLTRIDNITRFFDEALAAFGGVDIAINTVGKVLKKPFGDTTEEEYDSMADINS
nr:SDR family NAD(P)-dependent oxidoreductase [Dyadobacter fermentans]